ncbi:MAG: ABC transporter substrate-binding protein [Verrucomicrobia bacterium]|nr:ABC transporter substrate-binding protein [Verrucomicrobiota bacterium]
MTPLPPSLKIPTARPRTLRLGYLALTDAAPIVVAAELGLFARHGIAVEIQREIGWATIREKIVYGELDAAQAPAPMLWSAQLGIGCPPTPVLTALVLSRHGNALTLSRRLWDAGVRDGPSLREFARGRRGADQLTFGVVFPFSSHHLLLRGWLQGAGLDPERDVRIVVVPPAQMYRNLAAGTLDGFCSGDPWNSVAVARGAGWCPTWSAAADPGQMEKVLLVTHRFAETRAAVHGALVRALAEAAAWCDVPANRPLLADLLADRRHLNLPRSVVAAPLLGRFDDGTGRVEEAPDFFVFHRDGAGTPSVAKAAALQQALTSAGLLPRDTAPHLPRRLFRDDLHRDFLHTQPNHDITTAPDLRGVAAHAPA